MPDNPSDRPGTNPFDTPTGYSGQDYHRDREAELARQEPSGQVDPQGPSTLPDDTGAADLGPDNGRRASFDPATGALQGSGAKDGEEFDKSPIGGSGYSKTGADGESEGREQTP